MTILDRFSLTDKVVIVTGAVSGAMAVPIGRPMATGSTLRRCGRGR